MNLRNIRYALLALLVSCQPALMDDQGGALQLVSERTHVEFCDETELFNRPINAERAVFIALLRNPQVRVQLENISLAQADLVAASEMKNPVFELLFRFSDTASYDADIQFGVAQNIIDICLRPLRMARATAELEQIKWNASHEILQVALDAEEHFYELKAAELMRNGLKESLAVAQAQAELADEQLKAGVISPYEARKMIKAATEIQESYLVSEIEEVKARKSFEVLLGNPCSYVLVEDLPTIHDEWSLDCLQEGALTARLDLQALYWELEQLRRSIPETSWWAYTGLAVGAEAEREPEGNWIIGPGIAGEIPLFTNGKSDRMKVFALYRQKEAEVESLKQSIIAEVKEAVNHLEISGKRASLYLDKLIPLQKQITEDVKDYYDVMALGAGILLEERRSAVDVRINAIMALKDYWVAKVHLKRAVGGL